MKCDALVVGGGPAGSTCARILRLAGWNVVLVDRATFPRDKVCAGWLTPGVFPLLDLDPAEYQRCGTDAAGDPVVSHRPHRQRTQTRDLPLIETQYPTSSAMRSGGASSTTFCCTAREFESSRARSCIVDSARGDTWIVNDNIEAPVVIGAGGHFCPVARHLRGTADTTLPDRGQGGRVSRWRERRTWRMPRPNCCSAATWRATAGASARATTSTSASAAVQAGTSPSTSGTSSRCSSKAARLAPGTDIRWRGHAYFASGVGPRPLIGAGA